MITASLSPTAFVVNNCATNNFGLGNKLFKVSAALGLAKKHNDKAFFPDLQHRNHSYFKKTIFRNVDTAGESNIDIKNKFKWYRSGYTEIPYSPNLNLTGDFQSWKFFKNISEEIKTIFEPCSTFYKELENSIYKDLLEKENTVSIHVRRGDYVKNQDQYKMINADYVKSARMKFKKESIFVIFSDDITWCKKNIKMDNSDVFVENQNEVFDLYLMSLMKNNIISNSTFSWWAAYLNKNKNKKVVSPAEWFGPKLKKQGYYTDSDLLLDEWITI